jgi:hypothetical protein
MTRLRIARALASAALLIVLLGGAAQTPPAGQAAPPAAYRPGLGDLMTMTVQPRHIKLALAGREQNWAYAAYELRELEEAFERVARSWPQWRAVPIAEMIPALTHDPMTALAQAIKAADATKFAAAYGQLTDGCNACHKAADRAVIVIQPPTASSFPDQDFRPAQ